MPLIPREEEPVRVIGARGLLTRELVDRPGQSSKPRRPRSIRRGILEGCTRRREIVATPSVEQRVRLDVAPEGCVLRLSGVSQESGGIRRGLCTRGVVSDPQVGRG
jgi:hypothetical protein